MSNKTARRSCGNAIRMQQTICKVAVGVGILTAYSTDALGTRGRVSIANNTVVTDRGTLIRGGRVSLDIWDETPSQSDIDTMKNERGLNAFHIYAEYAGSGQSGGYNVSKVDNVVDLADENDLYVVLTIGCGGDNGSFSQNFVTQFWDFYAPRYKDRTHVVYELMNEPQAWSAPYNNATLTMEKNGYDQIRALAPDTHIMMMSYSQPNNWTDAANECEGLGIDWSNASVAFHTYGIDGKEQSTLNSFFSAMQGKGIAYTCTEPNLTLQAITAGIFEDLGVSQTYFINVHEIATNDSSFASWILSNNICWTPDFGTWPCGNAAGGASGTGGDTGAGGSSQGGDTSAGGTSSEGGDTGSGGTVGRGGAQTDNGGAQTDNGGAQTDNGGAQTAGGSGTGGSGTGGSTIPGNGGSSVSSGGGSGLTGSGGSTVSGNGGSSVSSGGSAVVGGGSAGIATTNLGGGTATAGAAGDVSGTADTSSGDSGCGCVVAGGDARQLGGGVAALLMLMGLAFTRRRKSAR